jgi:hypothetical protein
VGRRTFYDQTSDVPRASNFGMTPALFLRPGKAERQVSPTPAGPAQPAGQSPPSAE